MIYFVVVIILGIATFLIIDWVYEQWQWSKKKKAWEKENEN